MLTTMILLLIISAIAPLALGLVFIFASVVFWFVDSNPAHEETTEFNKMDPNWWHHI